MIPSSCIYCLIASDVDFVNGFSPTSQDQGWPKTQLSPSWQGPTPFGPEPRPGKGNIVTAPVGISLI